jgi:hypothetical protein
MASNKPQGNEQFGTFEALCRHDCGSRTILQRFLNKYGRTDSLTERTFVVRADGAGQNPWQPKVA